MNKRAQQILLRGLYVAAGAAIVVLVFRHVAVDAVTRAVTGIGYSFIGVVTIYLIGCVFDVAGWRRLMPSSGRNISFLQLLAIHIAGESFYRFIPAGAVIGDSVKVILSRSIFHIDSSQAVSSLVLRKIFMGMAQVVYIGLAVLFGIFLHRTGTAGSLQLTGGILASALFALFFSMALWIRKGTLCVPVFALLMKVPSDTLREKLSAQKHVFIETDVLLRDVLQNRRSDVLTAVVFFVGNWLTELLETVVILALLGASVPITGAMLFEPVISLVRSIAFIFPGGLGIMDAGYASALQLYGIPNAAVIAAALIVIKRSKELVWIIIGITLTLILGRNTAQSFIKFMQPGAAAETA